MSVDLIVHADCADADLAEAASVAIAALTRGGTVHTLGLERLGEPREQRWTELGARDAFAIARAELGPRARIVSSFGAELPSGRPMPVFLRAFGAEYTRLYSSKPLLVSVDPADLAAPAPHVAHDDLDALVRGLVGDGEAGARVTKAVCGVEGSVPALRDAWAAYYARVADVAAELGVPDRAADAVAALEMAATSLPLPRGAAARVARSPSGALLLSVTPLAGGRHSTTNLAPLIDAATALLAG
jgi:hypothetical protein